MGLHQGWSSASQEPTSMICFWRLASSCSFLKWRNTNHGIMDDCSIMSEQGRKINDHRDHYWHRSSFHERYSFWPICGANCSLDTIIRLYRRREWIQYGREDVVLQLDLHYWSIRGITQDVIQQNASRLQDWARSDNSPKVSFSFTNEWMFGTIKCNPGQRLYFDFWKRCTAACCLLHFPRFVGFNWQSVMTFRKGGLYHFGLWASGAWHAVDRGRIRPTSSGKNRQEFHAKWNSFDVQEFVISTESRSIADYKDMMLVESFWRIKIIRMVRVEKAISLSLSLSVSLPPTPQACPFRHSQFPCFLRGSQVLGRVWYGQVLSVRLSKFFPASGAGITTNYQDP